jgi:hypothetical protein
MIMETEVSKSKFKAKALEIFRRVELTGRPVVITDRGNPSLILKKYVAPTETPLQRLKDSIVRYDDPMAPVGEDDWEAIK